MPARRSENSRENLSAANPAINANMHCEKPCMPSAIPTFNVESVNTWIKFDKITNAHTPLDAEPKKVNNNVSSYSKNKVIREKLIDIQRSFSDRNLVADGRDLGAVVFPTADYKFFLTADINVRAKRIFESKGFDLKEISDLKEIRDNLEVRDFIDSTRKNSPLVKSDQAILIDTSDLSIREQCDKIYKVIKK